MQININNAGWENVGRSGTRAIDHGYQFTGTVQVRAYDTEGQVSAIKPASARTVDPPPPPVASAVSGKGTSGYWPGYCTHSSCGLGTVTVKNFPAGNYTLSCNGTGQWGGTWGSETRWVPANGTVELSCYFGSPNERFWVSIGGWGNAQQMNWY